MDIDTPHRSQDDDAILSNATHRDGSADGKREFGTKELVTIHLVAGSLSKVTESLLMYPLDTIKTRLQFQGEQSRQSVKRTYSGILHALKSTIRHESLRGVYRGYLAHILYVVPSAAISFVCYEAIVKQIKKTHTAKSERSMATSFGGGVTSGTADGGLGVLVPILGMTLARVSGSIIRTPFDVIKMRQQVSGSLLNEKRKQENQSAYQILKRLLKSGGLLKWSSVSLLRDLPFSAIYFTSYELSRNYQKKLINLNNHTNVKRKLTPINNLTAGAIAGAVGTILTIPIDVIKTNLQTQDLLPKEKRRSSSGIVSAIKYIISTEGYRGLTKGLGTRLLVVVPSAALSFSSYEYIKKALIVLYSKDN
ncbi:hypothetical protein CYY_004055 [Polysphondylium violaceum]|uniref:Mitochondrial substrate carrier family protein n=1 Tax=Polysphondylium violaceum TaxID=133409 RepID=A0A8J4PWT8_9MYCE|nr:hypothetical protein CYY_004055 [Polysphondylium violaceum]